MQATIDGEKERVSPSSARRQPLLWAGGIALACAALIFCYLRVTGVTVLNSDGAGIVLQASSFLHGNVLLHGWADTDVSFYTTELPLYSAVTLVAGVRPEVVHICGALTYVLLLLLAALVARGRSRGAAGLVRALLAIAIMLAPQAALPGETFVVLGSPDHFGTAVPLLLLLLLLDRPGMHWYVPLCTCLLLAWSTVGDPILEVLAVIPVALACLLRAGRITAVCSGVWGRTAEQRDTVAWSHLWYEAAIAAAAAVAVPLANFAYDLIRHLGGYEVGPARYHQASWHTAMQNASLAWRSVLEVFSADYYGQPPGSWDYVFALAHLAFLGLVIVGVGLAGWRLLWPARAARLGDRVADVLVLAIAGNIAGFLLMTKITNLWDAHEIAAVLPIGAALAGRMLGDPLARLRTPGFAVLAGMLAGGAVMLAVAVAAPQGIPENTALAGWLEQHHLTHGMSSYWMASSTSVDSGDKISMLSVSLHGYRPKLAPDAWENHLAMANPATNKVNFFVTQPGEGDKQRSALHLFGKPAHTYHYLQYTIMIWHKNLLSGLGSPPPV
jgi:hypothetical protein